MEENEQVKRRKVIQTHSIIVALPVLQSDAVVEIKVINLQNLAVKRSIVDHHHVKEQLRGMDVRRVRNRYPLVLIIPIKLVV